MILSRSALRPRDPAAAARPATLKIHSASPLMAKVRTPPIYTTPCDAALAFYQAFEAKDIDAMMSTWAEDEEIVCVHPGGTRLVGYDAVRVGWEQLFAGDARLSFRLDQMVMIETVGLAMQSAVEHVSRWATTARRAARRSAPTSSCARPRAGGW